MSAEPLSVFLFAVSTLFQIQQKKKMEAEADKRKGQKLQISGEAAPLPVCYGKNAMGGIAVKHATTSSYTAATDNSDAIFAEGLSNSNASGSKNNYLHVQYAICHDGIEGVQWVRVNDVNYNETKQNFKHSIRTFKDGGSADAIATANGIASTNTFTNTAFASATYQLDRDDPQYSGPPNTLFLLKGRKVKWIEESGGVYSLSAAYEYSNNPALCLLDYLMNSDFGLGLAVGDIDLESFYNAAEVCDTVVDTNRTVAGKVNGQKAINTVADVASLPSSLEKRTYENELWYTTATGQYWYWNKTSWVQVSDPETNRPIPLYECNIALDTSEKIRDNIESLLSTMGLAELTWTSEGKYKLLLEYPTNSAEQDALVDSGHIFTEDDIIRDSITLSWSKASDRYNQATVSFLNEHEDFKEDSITWPETGSTAHNTYLTEDNNRPFKKDLSPKGVTDPYHALALAEQTVRQSRGMYSLDMTVTKKGLSLEPGDFIKVTTANSDLSNDIFRVQSIKVNPDFTVSLTCYAFDFNFLAWNVADDVAYAVQPTFDFEVAAPTSGSFTVDTSTAVGFAAGKLDWTAADDISVVEYLIEISADNGTTWNTLGVTRNVTYDVVGLLSGTYDFSIRSRTALGSLSTRLLVEDETVQLTTPTKVAIIYADTADETTNTQSYTLGSNTFVAYYNYTGDLPTLPITTGITFTQFVGDPGDPGDPGDAGDRGAGWWRYETGTAASTAGLSNAAVEAFFSTATGLAETAADRFIVVNTANEATGYLRNDANTSWVEQEAFLDGNLLVEGTVTADTVVADGVDAAAIQAGAVKTANIDLDENLFIDNNGAGIIGGRDSATEYDSTTGGFYFGRELRSGGALGFEVSHTNVNASNEIEGIIHTDETGLMIFNPKLKVKGNVTGGFSEFTTSNTTATATNLGSGDTIDLVIVGGGGGGGYGKADGSSSSVFADSGTTTTLYIYDGDPNTTGVLQDTYNATGGAGGQSAHPGYLGKAGTAGAASPYNGGAGGAGGARNSDGGDAPASSYGAGGGGAGGDKSSLTDAAGAAGLGGSAGQHIVVNGYDISGFSNDAYAVYTIGTGGAGDVNDYNGGDGADGMVGISSVLGGTETYQVEELVSYLISKSVTAQDNGPEDIDSNDDAILIEEFTLVIPASGTYKIWFDLDDTTLFSASGRVCSFDLVLDHVDYSTTAEKSWDITSFNTSKNWTDFRDTTIWDSEVTSAGFLSAYFLAGSHDITFAVRKVADNVSFDNINTATGKVYFEGPYAEDIQ